jgi:diacylglycerol kinase (ATP)
MRTDQSPDPKPSNRDSTRNASPHDHASHTPDIGSQTAESFAEAAKGKTGLNRIVKAAGFSADCFIAAYKNEAAFRQVLWLNAVLFIVLIFIPFTLPIKMALLIASFVSLITELFNTGIEASVDHTSTAKHPLAKIAKDVGSAAQFLALGLLFILWLMALWSLY